MIPAMAAIFGANYGFMLPVSTPPNAVLCVVGVAIMANVVGLV